MTALPKAVAERVARHLVMAGQLADLEPELAAEHAQAARREGARLAVVREACGLTAYRCGRFEQALAELRAARRMSGAVHVLPLLADCERGLGRPERALEVAASDDAGRLPADERLELRIVVAGARRDLGQPAAALAVLEAELRGTGESAQPLSLRYAYADLLEEAGRLVEAREWFARAEEADLLDETDAAQRWALLEERAEAGEFPVEQPADEPAEPSGRPEEPSQEPQPSARVTEPVAGTVAGTGAESGTGLPTVPGVPLFLEPDAPEPIVSTAEQRDTAEQPEAERAEPDPSSDDAPDAEFSEEEDT